MISSPLLAFMLMLGKSAFSQEPTRTCAASCSLHGELMVMSWRPSKTANVDRNGITHSFDPSKTGTVYFITIINTVENKTSVTTSNKGVWAGYTPPLTDPDGTLVNLHTYTFKGQERTATVTYPTPFLEWPDSYGVERFSDDSGDCIDPDRPSNITVNVTVNPQPSERFLIDPDDPLGWAYTLAPGISGGSALRSNLHWMPDPTSAPHAEVTSCNASHNYAFDFFAYFQGSWKVVAVPSTILEGEDGGKVTAGATSGSKETQKPSSLTEVPGDFATITPGSSSATLRDRPGVHALLGLAIAAVVLGG
ncbi:hypothetical protein B0T14DRAFT_563928 [Immersiella caudata]|uniref:Uncharacterized protein n=1 Tax=Immersiella caudata TaxID=314043 RepID=A0AA39WVR8_9PEZI|nr:hypothetical protein B0T14DRAFT_563928 [Immersiella caudata]